MAENDKDSADKDKALAEKAYEAAASSASEKAKAPVAEGKPATEPEAVKPAPVQVKPAATVPAATAKAPAKPAEAAPKAKAPVAPAKPKVTAKAAAKPKPAAKPAKAEPKPVKAEPKPIKTQPVEKIAEAEPAAAKPMAPVSKAAPKTADVKSQQFAGLFTNFLLEENTMDMSANFSGIQDAMTEAQIKAKAAFEKSTAMLGEVSDFTKGNVEAVMESGKILAEGVQGLGSEIVAEGRATFETISGDIKELAGAKSPTDFFKIQGDMMRKNFDSAVAYGSKNSETMLKLMSDAMTPISGRVSLAMEKVRQTSI